MKSWASSNGFKLVLLEEGTGRAITDAEASSAEKIVHIKPEMGSKSLVLTLQSDELLVPEP